MSAEGAATPERGDGEEPRPTSGGAASDALLARTVRAESRGGGDPALRSDAQVALTLRAVVGLTTPQFARATMTGESAVAQRIVRAKRKMAAAGIPLRVPEGAERVARLDTVLAVVAALYSTANLAADAGAAADRDVADDALWLAAVVADALPREAEAWGLLALLQFHRSRESARAVGGRLVPLGEQDRSRWDAGLLARARASLDRAALLRRPGRWQLHAAIAACHADAVDAAATDWLQILTLYDVLLRHDASDLVRLNRAVALAAVEGAAAGLAEVEAIGDGMADYHLWHAVRGRLLRDLDRGDDAVAADLRALELTVNLAERDLLAGRAGIPSA